MSSRQTALHPASLSIKPECGGPFWALRVFQVDLKCGGHAVHAICQKFRMTCQTAQYLRPLPHPCGWHLNLKSGPWKPYCRKRWQPKSEQPTKITPTRSLKTSKNLKSNQFRCWRTSYRQRDRGWPWWTFSYLWRWGQVWGRSARRAPCNQFPADTVWVERSTSNSRHVRRGPHHPICTFWTRVDCTLG